MPQENPNTQFNHNYDLEDWDIIDLFKDTIWAEFIDEVDEESVSRGGIVIPTNISQLKDFYRILRVLKVGPECSDSVKEGVFLLMPPQMGMKGLKKGPNGCSSVFVREDKVMAVIEPNNQRAVDRKKQME